MLDAASAQDSAAGVLHALHQLHDAAALLLEGHHVVELIPHLQHIASLSAHVRVLQCMQLVGICSPWRGRQCAVAVVQSAHASRAVPSWRATT